MDFIEVGKIVNTHGLKGHVKVEPWCDDISTFEYLTRVFLNETEYGIESVKEHKNSFLVKLKGIDYLDVAEKYKGVVVHALLDEMPPLPEGVYYIRDILGLKVYEDDEYIGEIVDWIETGSKNVYIIKRPAGKDVLIPATDDFIKNIDIENKKMSVKLMEGLIVE